MTSHFEDASKFLEELQQSAYYDHEGYREDLEEILARNREHHQTFVEESVASLDRQNIELVSQILPKQIDRIAAALGGSSKLEDLGLTEEKLEELSADLLSKTAIDDSKQLLKLLRDLFM